MGYLFLFIALLAGSTKGYCGKKTSGYTKSLNDAVFANTLRMFICAMIGFFLVIANDGIAMLKPSVELLLVSALSGISTAIFVVAWLISVKKSAYMMLDVFLMLGVLVPLILGKIFFSESIKITQWLGIAILFIAVLIMCSYNNSIKTKIDLPSLILLLICGISNGITDFSQKLFVKTIEGGSAASFNFYTYVFTAMILLVTLFVTKEKDNTSDKQNKKKIFGYILVMAVCLFMNSYFKTLAANHLSSVLLYPLNQGCALILSTLMATILFKEKLTLKAIIGIVTAFIGLLIINLL